MYNVTVIDDDRSVRDILAVAGKTWGNWFVKAFPEVTPESLEGNVDILLLDHALKGSNADNAQKEIEMVREAHPGTLLVYMSGYEERLVRSRLNGQGKMVDRFLPKPIMRYAQIIPELNKQYEMLRK